MTIKEFLDQLRRLDPRDVGRWPLVFRLLAIALTVIVATAVTVWYFVYSESMGNMPELRKAQAKQVELWNTFDQKQRKAANLEVYKQQLAEIDRTFGAMLRQLPGRTEVPNLLVDISQTGLAAGLRERLFEPGPEQRKDFYAELPIRIRLTGTYHEFGEFVSGIAALPRIVTLHDIQISSGQGRSPTSELTLDLTARTYRYLEDSEQEPETGAKQGK